MKPRMIKIRKDKIIKKGKKVHKAWSYMNDQNILLPSSHLSLPVNEQNKKIMSITQVKHE